jgi:GxxExxY protein
MTRGSKDARNSFNVHCASAPLRHCVKKNTISRDVVRCALEVHRTLGGPGLLESVYEEALAWELSQTGLDIQRQVNLPIPYKGRNLASPLCIDLIVGRKVIVECKANSNITIYLRLSYSLI